MKSDFKIFVLPGFKFSRGRGRVLRIRRGCNRTFYNRSFKWTVGLILSDPPCDDGNARFTTVHLKVLSDQV